MTRRGSSIRAAALRRAQEAKALRDAERTRRKSRSKLHFPTTGGTADAERTHSTAWRKTEQTSAEAGQAAAKRWPQPVGRTAAEGPGRRHRRGRRLCGITAAVVREILAGALGPAPP
jgi:hypothetical protein